MPLLNPSLFGSDYTPSGSTAPYPDTTFMGMLTGLLPAVGGLDSTPSPEWGKTVSLEGGLGPGRPAPPPGSDDAPGAPGARGEAATGDGSRAPKKLGFGDILNKIGDMINARSGTLMALGAGMAGAPSIGIGVGRGLQMALPAMQQDIAQQKQNQTAQFLAQRGMPPELAQLAVNNPDVLKSLLPRLFGVGKQYQHITVTDAMGNPHVLTFDPDTGQIKPVSGTGGVDLGGGIDTDAAVAATKDYMEKGAIPKNSDLADLVAATHAYMTGGVMPTGNPRQRAIASNAKLIAQRVAMDLGRPELADDALYPARRTMSVDLAKSSNSSMGGILTNGGSAFDHLAELSEAMARQGQYGSSSSIPGSQGMAAGWNWLTNQPALASTDTAGRMTAVTNIAGHYGQESTKFYSGIGAGDAAERARALEAVAQKGSTATEQADFLLAERNLMLDRLRNKVNQVDNTLGESAINKKFPTFRGDLEKALTKIDANIAKLRAGNTGVKSEVPAAPAGSAATIPPEKLKPGTTIKFDRYGRPVI